MRIALISDVFFPHMGGIETALNALAKEYMQNGHDVALFVRDCNFLGDIKYIDKFQYKVYRHTVNYHNIKQSKNILYSNLEAFNPTVIHIHDQNYIGYWGALFGNKKHIPVVCTVHGNLSYVYDHIAPYKSIKFLHRIYIRKMNKLIRKTCIKSDILTAVSQSAIDNELRLACRIKKDALIVRNGYEQEKIQSILLNKKQIVMRENTNEVKLCFAGRIAWEKNLDFSFNVCKNLLNIGVPFHFFLAGEGNDFDFYNSFVKEMHLDKNVSFIGRKDMNSLVDLYIDSDFLLFPSIFDTDGLVIKDANKCGCPALVIKDTGASEQIIDGVNGYILDNDVNAFVEFISKWYNRRKYTEKKVFREKVSQVDIPSWHSIAREYMNVYKKLIDGKI